MSTLAIVPTSQIALPALVLSPEFLARREEAIASAALVARVTNAGENVTAVEAQKQLVGLVREVEAARKTLKAPVLDLGRKIDAVANEAKAPLETAAAPVVQKIADFAAAERERERKELLRIEAERRAAEDAANEARRAEQARIAEAAAIQIAAAKSKAAAERIALEAEQASLRVAEQARCALQAAEERALLDKQANAAAKASGQTIRPEWEITVVDIWALARAHPACVKIEPRLTEIKSILDAGGQVSGVIARRVTAVSVRTSGKVIEV